jgi:hypothetical protein
MQILVRGLQISMPEQYLNSTQIRTRLQQVGRPAMP